MNPEELGKKIENTDVNKSGKIEWREEQNLKNVIDKNSKTDLLNAIKKADNEIVDLILSSDLARKTLEDRWIHIEQKTPDNTVDKNFIDINNGLWDNKRLDSINTENKKISAYNQLANFMNNWSLPEDKKLEALWFLNDLAVRIDITDPAFDVPKLKNISDRANDNGLKNNLSTKIDEQTAKAKELFAKPIQTLKDIKALVIKDRSDTKWREIYLRQVDEWINAMEKIYGQEDKLHGWADWVKNMIQKNESWWWVDGKEAQASGLKKRIIDIDKAFRDLDLWDEGENKLLSINEIPVNIEPINMKFNISSDVFTDNSKVEADEWFSSNYMKIADALNDWKTMQLESWSSNIWSTESSKDLLVKSDWTKVEGGLSQARWDAMKNYIIQSFAKNGITIDGSKITAVWKGVDPKGTTEAAQRVDMKIQ